mgnify:FL=1
MKPIYILITLVHLSTGGFFAQSLDSEITLSEMIYLWNNRNASPKDFLTISDWKMVEYKDDQNWQYQWKFDDLVQLFRWENNGSGELVLMFPPSFQRKFLMSLVLDFGEAKFSPEPLSPSLRFQKGDDIVYFSCWDDKRMRLAIME